MSSFLCSTLIGAACGILSAFGIGGGSLLMVWLTAVLSMEQQAARSINLLYFLPTAVAALIFHAKHRQVQWRTVIPAAICGCMTAILGAMLSGCFQVDALRRIFGGFLILVGLRELFCVKKKSE